MIRFVSWLFFTGALMIIAGCQKAPSSPDTKPLRYDVRGIVRGIGFAQNEITVEHEEIPGFMPAMTMPFSVKEMREVERLSVGDAIRFELVVTDHDSWITNVQTIAKNEVQLPQTTAPARKNPSLAVRLKEGDRLPEFELVDDQNRPVTRATFAGAPCILTFIFTRCPIPNFCPLMSKNFAEVHGMLAENPKLAGTRLLSISFDPEYDTPAQLAKYATAHRSADAGNDTWRFATGSNEEIAKLTAAFAVSVKPESGTISHGLATALIDADGVIRRIWRGNGWQPAEVMAELEKL
ncbi:MAG TPA: SCO family protein [Chthoniobacteraceae bacterium]|nr:SCO family protein [Chthoniobacteraceae bacterium]